MRKAKFRFTDKEMRKYPPPCKSMERIYFTFEESDHYNRQDLNKFWFGILNYEARFKEIREVKAIDLHSLIGNIGGYVGMILGATFMQIPDCLMELFKIARRVYRTQVRRSE